MKLAIFGVLLGGGLFVGGFVNHDIDYTGGPQYRTMSLSPNEEIWVHPDFHIGDKEGKAFLVATAGSMILTASIKHLWTLRKGKPRKPYGKFQLSRDVAAGFTLWMIGANTHDYGRFENDGLVRWRLESGEWGPLRNRRHNDLEKLGFGGGMLGAVWMAAAAKHKWDVRKTKPVPEP